METEIFVNKKDFPALNCLFFGYENCEKSHFYGPALRMYWLIHFVESGCGIFKINNKTYPLKSGDMFIIPPFVETYYEADSESPWQYSWIAFTCNGKLPIELSPTVHCPKAAKVFGEMRDCKNLSGSRNAFMLARLWDLFALLSQDSKDRADYIEAAINYIHCEYMNELSVSKIADLLSLERSYFTVLFKKNTGISPGKYIFNYRMEIAAKLMVENGKNVTVAANSVGYTDIYNFSRMFKRHFGISPRSYAKKHQCQNM